MNHLATMLPAGVRSRMVENGNGLLMHVLEAGFETPDRPCILLLHGFPELAYSWRKIMLPLAAAGAYVVAPDQRGYGRTTGWDGRYDGDLAQFHLLNLAQDVLGLLAALGRSSVAAIVGHDFGSPLPPPGPPSPPRRVPIRRMDERAFRRASAAAGARRAICGGKSRRFARGAAAAAQT